MQMKYGLVIFDNDGVLIDSEIIWHKANVSLLNNAGVSITLDESIQLLSSYNCLDLDKSLRELTGKGEVESFISEVNNTTEMLYESELIAVNGIKTVLRYLLENNVDMCVASNGDKDYISRTLKLTSLDEYFFSENLFGAKQSSERKPSPYLFTLAAKQFGIDPKHCLVIEDHPLGIKAAISAGMIPIGFTGAQHSINPRHGNVLENAGAAEVFYSAEMLLEFLKKLCL